MVVFVISTNTPRIGHMPQSGNIQAAMEEIYLPITWWSCVSEVWLCTIGGRVMKIYLRCQPLQRMVAFVISFPQMAQNWPHASVWECTNRHGRNLPTCHMVITCIRDTSLHHRWKADKNSPEVSTIIKDNSILNFCKVTQHWALTTVWEGANWSRRNVLTCNRW